MPSLKQSLPIKKLSPLWSILTALLLLSSGCGTTIHDHIFCSPIPGGYGAACDHFLKHEPETLTEAQWEARQASWLNQGWAIECTESNAVGDLKAEIEKLCSKTQCDQDTADAAKQVVEALTRIQSTGTRTAECKPEDGCKTIP